MWYFNMPLLVTRGHQELGRLCVCSDFEAQTRIQMSVHELSHLGFSLRQNRKHSVTDLLQRRT